MACAGHLEIGDGARQIFLSKGLASRAKSGATSSVAVIPRRAERGSMNSAR
jgi:hypothetical protein